MFVFKSEVLMANNIAQSPSEESFPQYRLQKAGSILDRSDILN